MDRTTIENAALELFHKRGFDAVKVQDICAACGITKPTFTTTFPPRTTSSALLHDRRRDCGGHVAGTDPEGPWSSSWAPTWRSLTSASASAPTS